MVTTSQKHDDPFSRPSVRSALRSWDRSQKLGEHPLARLNIVQARRRVAGYAETPTGRGVALRDVLRDAIETLKPDQGDPDPLEKRWRPYIILTEQYLAGRSPDYVAEQLGIERDTYNHDQASALDTLADRLRQWEQQGIPRPATTGVIPRIQNFRGRKQELRYYLEQLEKDHLALVIGMPGAGKTALGAEIASQYQEKSNVFWMTFRQINTDIDSLFRELAVYLLELGREEFWNFLQLESEATQRYPLDAKIQHLVSVLRDGNYTLCFDNYHLVNRDREIATLFEVLREWATYGRMMYLIVMGQEKPAFAPDAEVRPLGGMNEDDALGLLADTGLARLPQNLFDKLYTLTGGNPMFLLLSSAWVVKSGLAGFESDEATRQVQQFIEGMVQTVDIETYLLTRVYNALNAEERYLVELMAAFQLPFDDRDEAVIEIFMDEGVENLSAVLASLLQKYIAMRVGATGYIDYHPLMRQFFYNRLRGRLPLKRRLHGRIGEYYEYVKENYLEAAYHYCGAADYLRGVQLLDAHREHLIGTGQAQRILQILSPLRKRQVPPPAWPLVTAIQGQAYAFRGEYDKALDLFEEALAEFENQPVSDEQRRRIADLARQIGRLYGWRGEYEKAHARMEQGLRILRDPVTDADRATAALIHTHTGSLYYLQGQYDRVETECQEALAILAGLSEEDVHAETYKVFGVIYDVTGRWEQAVAYARRSLAIWERLGNRHRIAELRDNLGTLHFYRGEFSQARALYEQNLAFWDHVGAKDNAGYARLNLGGVHLNRGEWDRAREYFMQALVTWRQVKNQKLAALAQNNLGFLEIAKGNYEDARQYLEQSVNADPGPENYRGLAEAELGLGHLQQALDYAGKSLELAREAGMLFEEGVTRRTLGRVYQALGDVDQARQFLTESLLSLEKLGARYEIGRTLYHLALLEVEFGDKEASQAHLGQAITIFEEVGAKKDLAQVRSLREAEPMR